MHAKKTALGTLNFCALPEHSVPLLPDLVQLQVALNIAMPL